jgi:hypothetical protein
MSEYMKSCQEDSNGPSAAEMYYNIGRLHHLLGIPSLAVRYYSQAAALSGDGTRGLKDVKLMSVTNQVASLLTLGNKDTALSLLKDHIVL